MHMISDMHEHAAFFLCKFVLIVLHSFLTTQASECDVNEPVPSPTNAFGSNPVVHQACSPDEATVNQNWHLKFDIPDLNNFSGIVREAVRMGVITGQARREIIQVLRTYITKYMLYPSSEQYITVCQKLVLKYPNLQDTEGKSNFVSKMKHVMFSLMWFIAGILETGFTEFF